MTKYSAMAKPNIQIMQVNRRCISNNTNNTIGVNGIKS